MEQEPTGYTGSMADYRRSDREGLAARNADAQLVAAMRAAHGRLCIRCTRCGRCKPGKLRKPTAEELADLRASIE